MIFFGSRASEIHKSQIEGPVCQYCQHTGPFNLTVFGRYFFTSFIPLFPTSKKFFLECSHCKHTVETNPSSPGFNNWYQENKQKIRRPFWHWLGIIIIGLMVSLNVLVTVLDSAFGKQVTDQRKALLEADLRLMTNNPTNESDSFSLQLKKLNDVLISKDLTTSEFTYRTIEKEDKVLFLLKIPELKSVKKESRSSIIHLIDSYAKSKDSLKDKKIYIGVHGKYNFMLVKTPEAEFNDNLVFDSHLYEFYGVSPE